MNRHRRWIVAIVGLVVVALVIAIGRPFVAVIAQSKAVREIQRCRWNGAEGWLRFAERLNSRDLRTPLLLARVSRKRVRVDEFRRRIEDAAARGVAADLLRTEVWMAEAQAGRLRDLEDHLGELFRNANEDTGEVCEAFVNGCVLNYRFDDAHVIVRLWHDEFPKAPGPSYIQGRVREHLGDYDLAEKEYREAIRVEPDHSPSLYNLARLLIIRQKPSEALNLYQQCLQKLEEPQPAEVGVGHCLRLLNRRDEARAMLLKAVEKTGPSVEESYRLLGDPAEVAAAKAATELGQLELDDKRFDESVRWFEKSLAANPQDWKVRFSFATALQRAGKTERAAPEFKRVTESKAEMARADKLLDDLRTKPNDINIRAELGQIFLKHSSQKQGLIWLHGVLQVDPEHQATHQVLADYYDQLGKSDPASASLADQHRKHLLKTGSKK